MGSNDHIPVPDPQPKRETTPEFIARVQGYCDAATDSCELGDMAVDDYYAQAYPADVHFVNKSRTDLPRALKVMECLERFTRLVCDQTDDELIARLARAALSVSTRILNGEEVDDG